MDLQVTKHIGFKINGCGFELYLQLPYQTASDCLLRLSLVLQRV